MSEKVKQYTGNINLNIVDKNLSENKSTWLVKTLKLTIEKKDKEEDNLNIEDKNDKNLLNNSIKNLNLD